MNQKLISVILFFSLVFIAASPGKLVFAERENPELEFLIENARKEINKQEALIHSLRKRYEDILKRKRVLQQFIDEENKKIEEFKLSKSRISAKPINAAAVPIKRPESKAAPKAPKETLSSNAGKELRGQEQEIAKRNAALEEVLKRQDKNAPAVLRPGVEKKKIPLPATEEAKQAHIREESLKRQIAQQEALLREKENKIKSLLERDNVRKVPEKKKAVEVANKRKEPVNDKKIIPGSVPAAKKQQQDQELLDRKLEKERLLAQEKEQRQLREKECQMKLLLEADKNAKHERYIAQLGQLLNRQNYLLEESRKLESQINQEEEALKVMEKTRQELIRKLLENH